LRRLADTNGFPAVFAGIGGESIVAAPPPPPAGGAPRRRPGEDYPGAVPDDPVRLAAQALETALRRQDPHEIVEQLLRGGELALAGYRRQSARGDFSRALERATDEERTSPGPATDPTRVAYRLMRARALIGLARAAVTQLGRSELSEQFRQWQDDLERAWKLADPLWADQTHRSAALRLRTRVLVVRADNPAMSKDEFNVAWERLRALIKAMTPRPPTPIATELATSVAECLLALARLGRSRRRGPDGAVSESAWREQRTGYALEAQELFGVNRDFAGAARATIEIGLIRAERFGESDGTRDLVRDQVRFAYQDAARYMDRAGPDDLSLPEQHEILTGLGLAETTAEQAKRTHLRALTRARKAEGIFPNLAVRSYYHLGKLSEDTERYEYFGWAISRWSNRSIGVVEEYADAFLADEVRDWIHDERYDRAFRTRAQLAVGPEAAMRAAVRAAWTKLRLGGQHREQDVAVIAGWLDKRRVPSSATQTFIDRSFGVHDAAELSFALFVDPVSRRHRR
ncbi:hypothetical protein I6A84_08415, partial [Frankia sp. CNm7]|uniref:hypothetical protein n=1 Tax=Frankia nepalensis TaxID=1836974 RepID=UPI0019324894